MVSEATKTVAATDVRGLECSACHSLDDRFRTPPWLFKVLDDEYDFRLDACAESEVALCKDYYSPEQDGLKQNWAEHGTVFCNPPSNGHQLGGVGRQGPPGDRRRGRLS